MYWLRVQMSYHTFNNLAGFLNVYLAVKNGRVILSIELMDEECNCLLLSKFNGECVYKGKFRKNI